MEGRLESVKVGVRNRLVIQWRLRGMKQGDCSVPEIYLHSRRVFQLFREQWIHAGTLPYQQSQFLWSFRIGGRKHSGGCGRSFLPRFAAIEYQNVSAALAQFQRQRYADDPRAGYDDIPGFHTFILTGEKKIGRA